MIPHVLVSLDLAAQKVRSSRFVHVPPGTKALLAALLWASASGSEQERYRTIESLGLSGQGQTPASPCDESIGLPISAFVQQRIALD
jgi:hypothetical protein